MPPALAEQPAEECLTVNGWSLDDLGPEAVNDGVIPAEEDTIELLKMYRGYWIKEEDPPHHIGNVMQFVMELLKIDPSEFSWQVFDSAFSAERVKLMRLQYFAGYHKLDGDMKMMLYEVGNVFFTIRDLVKQATRMLANLAPNNLDARAWMMPDAVDVMSIDNQNMFQHCEKDNTNFQNAFFHLREILEGCNYRRADGKFFKRIQLPNNLMANAYEEVCEIKKFVEDHTSHDSDFKAWRWITNPVANFDTMVEYLKNRPLSEAPDLEENTHIRSYAGDAHGNGAGVYNHNDDMFYPYDQVESWNEMARVVEEKRRKLFDIHYTCTPPKASDVGIVHLKCKFPFDIYDEVNRINTDQLFLCWVEVDHYECVHGRFSRVGTRWKNVGTERPETGEELKGVELLAEELLQRTEFTLQELRNKFGIRDLKAGSFVVVEVQPNVLHHFVEDAPEAEIHSEPLAKLLVARADCLYQRTSKGSLPRPRVQLSEEDWQFAQVPGDRITARSFVKTPEGRYFRVHTGLKWFDIPTHELDQIYDCQDFVDHDRYMLYAIKGRIFFKVGERDNFEGTIFTQGTGGCGKSTEVKVYQKFWPPHRRGILSANIQTQFGMANVAKGDVAWCTELSEHPNMPQEDWQDATSGHTVVCPVKHKQEPLVVHAWPAQFWWCSNVFPKGYKNKSKQVSRRLYGVGMYKPVRPRKDDIINTILPNLAFVQRRSILAYEDWLLQQGNIDPMSSIDTLPPAFADYYRKTVRETDPMEEFVTDVDWVIVEDGARMPMSAFRSLFNEYRQHYDMGKASRWCEEVYRNTFNDHGISVQKHGTIDWEGETLEDVDIVIGIRKK